jgi:hypothetical protein
MKAKFAKATKYFRSLRRSVASRGRVGLDSLTFRPSGVDTPEGRPRVGKVKGQRPLKQRKPKGPTVLTEASIELVSALMDNEVLGLRLLTNLEQHPRASVDDLHSVAQVGAEHLMLAMTRLAKADLVSVRDNKFSRTPVGHAVVKYLEKASGGNLQDVFAGPQVPQQVKESLWGILLPMEGSALKKVREPDSEEESTAGLKEAMKDPNYRKYMEEAARLIGERKHGFAAYANGERIGLADDMDQLMSQIADRVGEAEILIQEFPEKVVMTSRPFEVAA